MATLSFEIQIVTDDATFRLRGKQLSDAYVAMGLVRRTSGEDSGQIDWATVMWPVAGTSAGYEIFRFADTLQATAPVLIKITWGSPSYRDKIRQIVQVGVATDGAGTFLGLKTTARTLNDESSYIPSICYISGSTNRLCAWMSVQYVDANRAHMFAIERTHDAAGNDTAEGVLWLVYSNAEAALTNIGALSFVGGEIGVETKLSCLLPSVGSGSIGTQTSVYPIFAAPVTFPNPMLNHVVMFQNNCTGGVPVLVSLLGASRLYLPLYTGGSDYNFMKPQVRGDVSYVTYLMRWE